MATPLDGYLTNSVNVFSKTSSNFYNAFPTEAITNNIIYIHLVDQNINIIPDNTLNAFPNLKQLLICNSGLELIPNGALTGTNFTHLLLARNDLDSYNLPTLTNACQGMTHLDLSYNTISYITSTYFDGCVALREILVAFNQLCTIPDVSSVGGTLIKLSLDYNNIISPPYEWFLCMLEDMTTLTYIGLKSNFIEVIPDITQVTTPAHLHLDLQNNQLICDCRHGWLPDAYQYYYYDVYPYLNEYDEVYAYGRNEARDSVYTYDYCSPSSPHAGYALYTLSESILCPGIVLLILSVRYDPTFNNIT